MDRLRAIEGTEFRVDRTAKLVLIDRPGQSVAVPFNDLVRCLLWLSDRQFNDLDPCPANSARTAARIHG